MMSKLEFQERKSRMKEKLALPIVPQILRVGFEIFRIITNNKCNFKLFNEISNSNF